MIKVAMLLSLAAISLCLQANVVFADEVPVYDIAATCHSESQADASAGVAAACMTQEQSARETLAGQWNQFTAQSKTTCVQTETDVAGIRSYVELLTCLQIAKDAKSLPKE
jgi:hypothetical protein